MERLTDVFDKSRKGRALMAYLLIAQGERDKGMEELESCTNSMRTAIADERKDTRITNVRKQTELKSAEEVLSSVRGKREDFFQNNHWVHGHQHRIRRVAFSGNNKFVATMSSDRVKLWRVASGDKIVEIPIDSNDVAPD